MNTKPNTEVLSPEDRAKKLVSYLEEKSRLPEGALKDIHPEALKDGIEEVFRTAEETLKEIKGQK